MKVKKWFWILVIVAAAGALLGYRTLDAMRSDTKAPEITMETQTLEVSVEDPKSALLQGIAATDKKDGDVTDSLVVENITLLDSSGTASVTFAAFDGAGNIARGERKVVYTDYISPRFTLEKPLVYTQGTNFDMLSNVGAEDVFDGDIQHRVRAAVLGEETMTSAGTYVVQFQVTNSLGDTHTQNFPVEITMGEYNDASMELSRYILYLPVGAGFNAQSYLKSFTYQRNRMDLTGGNLPSGLKLETKGQVQTQNPGTYTVSYELTYTQMNADRTAVIGEHTAYSKLIVVVEG